MTDYTILPSASATLCYSIGADGIAGGLRGVNTKPAVVGAAANRLGLLVLIEFRPGGLYPLLRIPQTELLDSGFPFQDIDAGLHRRILGAVAASRGITSLKECLDGIFLSRLSDARQNPQLCQAMKHIRASGGTMGCRRLSGEVFLSERELGRIFGQQLGVGVKTFSRIVRINRAVKLLQRSGGTMASVAAGAGFFDQSHFIRDFHSLCGTTPKAYTERMSIFYNDAYKL